MTLNLRNVNQLQEYIMIKVNEKFDSEQSYYLETVFKKELLIDLIKNKVFKDITLYSMMTRGIISMSDIEVQKMRSLEASGSNDKITNEKNQSFDSNIGNNGANDEAKRRDSGSAKLSDEI